MRVASTQQRSPGLQPTRTRDIGCCAPGEVRLTCAKNKGERGCVGGGGRVELGDGRAVGDVRRSLSEE